MSNNKILFGATLSVLLFSGAAISHGVQNDSSGDIVSGHSSDHKDPALTNAGRAQKSFVVHQNHDDKDDVVHRITVHMETLRASPSSPPGPSQLTNRDDAPSVIREVTAN